MFNPGGIGGDPMQQNFRMVIDTGIKNSVIGHFNLVSGGSSGADCNKTI
jgi:hypothetical protein